MASRKYEVVCEELTVKGDLTHSLAISHSPFLSTATFPFVATDLQLLFDGLPPLDEYHLPG